MTKRRRVLFLINSLTGGGAERVMCTLLRHSEAERAEFDMTLALLDDESRANDPPEWMDVRQFDCRGSMRRSLATATKLMAELKPDVSVSFLSRSNLANVLSMRGPCVISERANTTAHAGSGTRGLVTRNAVRLLYPRANRIIAVSEGVADELRDGFGVPAATIVTIPNPVDIEMINAKAAEPAQFAAGEPYILGAGRLVKMKNFELLIRAFAASGDTRKLVIAGEGPELAALRGVAQECGVADRVVFPGFIQNPYALMRGADLFVLSSNSEGFPNALVEAMALGVPVIAANCRSGPSEILANASRESITELTHAPFGVLTPPNDVARMTDALKAMQNPELRRHYGEKAAARARDFSAVAAKDKYWTVIRAALASQPGRSAR